MKDLLDELRPKSKPTVMKLVSDAGLKTLDWANFKGGEEKAATNPKYCYNWCFDQHGILVFNIWHENLERHNGSVRQRLNLKRDSSTLRGPQKSRALKFDRAARRAFEYHLHPRVIILDRKEKGVGSATARMLDDAPWTVPSYDIASGEFVLLRGIADYQSPEWLDPEAEQFLEGFQRKSFYLHRSRESALRRKKIEQNKARNGGRVVCEVPGCGFDFEKVYGDKGEGYGHVHHLVPLSQAGAEGVSNSIDGVAVVCANCHAIIHRGGKCLEMTNLIPKR